MINMIRLKRISEEYGDCSADYEVKLDKEYTVKEFSEWISQQKGEWGHIAIYNPNVSWVEYERYEYKYGQWIGKPIPESLMKKKIVNVSAHGGWSQMNYTIKVEDIATESILKDDKLYHFGNISVRTNANGSIKVYADKGSLAILPHSDNTITIKERNQNE